MSRRKPAGEPSPLESLREAATSTPPNFFNAGVALGKITETFRANPESSTTQAQAVANLINTLIEQADETTPAESLAPILEQSALWNMLGGQIGPQTEATQTAAKQLVGGKA